MFRTKALCFSVVILLCLSLTGCAGTSGEPGSTPAPSAATPAPSKEAGTPAGEKIWSVLPARMQVFADSFSENDIRSLSYSFATEGGITSYTVDDPDIFRLVFDALDEITIAGETQLVATDNGDIFTFLTNQDERYSFSFNMHNLETAGHIYQISGDSALWQAADRIMEENLPDGAEPPEDEFILAQSNTGHFRFFYKSTCPMEEGENNTVIIYLDDQKDPQKRITVGRTTGPDAVTFLEEKASEIRTSHPDSLVVDPGEPELLEIDNRGVYGIYTEFGSKKSTDSVQTWFAEDCADGSMLWYEAVFTPELTDEAETAVRTILETIELDDWEGGTADDRKSAESFMEGRWSWTVETLPDGNTEYCFDDLLIVDIPENWEGKYLTEAHDNFFSFYHIGSYNKFMEQYGTVGGHLFTVAWYTDKEYENLPNYRYLGLAPEGYYVMILPTDVQGWMDDDSVWEEWMELQEGMDFVESNAMSMLMI